MQWAKVKGSWGQMPVSSKYCIWYIKSGVSYNVCPLNLKLYLNPIYLVCLKQLVVHKKF